MRVVLVLACLLGLSLGASLERKPLKCKSPPLLTGAFSFATQNEKVFLYAQYEYDAWQQRIRMYEVGKYQNQSFTYDFLLLFKEGLMYEINSKSLKCAKMALKAEFPPLGVPPNASFLGSAVIGSSSAPGEGLLVNTWTGLDPEGGKFMTTVTEFGCIPVTTLFQTKEYGWVAFNFMNNVDGIADPSALNPPPFCPSREVEPIGEPIDFFAIIKNIGKNAP